MQRILVIEDEPLVRLSILELLEAEDYEAIGAEDGSIGVERARQYNPDLILCDVMMPELDGYGVLSTLQQDQKTATIPFIFLTAKAAKTDIREGIELGADNYLTKPFTRAELLSAITARLASLDQHPYPVELIPQFLGQPSVDWIYKNLISPQIEKDYRGWHVAIEPESGKCFLGPTLESAHQAARVAFPTAVFYYCQVKNTAVESLQEKR
ncbi:response regulator transcription factor [Leptolyngbya sp. FACHB-261]|uniref:response regulator transcription factor n=1 Tax=Leptolyngbya sp. FACHB-261 TaxID=2692806 RepID=UPI0016849738|nr:response regulator [Leptolyngbya sp. FACHB-261]MBD2102732.1 response regulator [Leptolyngbya sp. FACHB-261]